MTSYYDMVLGFIPVLLFGIGGVLHVIGLSQQVALATGGFLALGLMSHAMFVNAPIDRDGARQSSGQADSTSTVSMSD